MPLRLIQVVIMYITKYSIVLFYTPTIGQDVKVIYKAYSIDSQVQLVTNTKELLVIQQEENQ